ncbi:MAG TPA: hypothetical protein VLJ37_06420 [bacterium]|nr:hypothetical protein [bacterium]
MSQLFSVAPASAGAGVLSCPADLFLPETAADAGSLAREQVVVVKGHDHIERVLQKFDVPFLPPVRCDDRNPINEQLLRGATYLFVNCGGALADGDPVKIAAWVEGGGRLLTTDRMVYHLLEPGFLDEKGRPLVRYHEKSLSTDEAHEFPVSEAAWDDPAARVLLRDGERIFWKVKKCSYPVQIVDPHRVQVLARSSQLGAMFPGVQGTDALFLRFAYGRGTVLHLMSHWDCQELEGEIRESEPPSPRSVTFIREKN